MDISITTSHPSSKKNTKVLSSRKHMDVMFSWMLPCCQTLRSNLRSVWIAWFIGWSTWIGWCQNPQRSGFKHKRVCRMKMCVEKQWFEMTLMFICTSDGQMLDSSLICQSLTLSCMNLHSCPHSSSTQLDDWLTMYRVEWLSKNLSQPNLPYAYIHTKYHTSLCIDHIYIYIYVCVCVL